MARCSRCGKHFWRKSKLRDGLCPGCVGVYDEEKSEKEKELDALNLEIELRTASLENDIAQLESRLADKKALYEEALEEAKTEAAREAERLSDQLKKDIDALEGMRAYKARDLQSIQDQCRRTESKLAKIQGTYTSMLYAVKYQAFDGLSVTEEDLSALSLAPAPVQALGVKQLRARYRQNERNIDELYQSYRSNYTTKTNAAIYQLMVLALEAELQNILSKLGFGKLDAAQDAVKALTSKYYRIASDGNQTIAPTLAKFIAQLEYFYLEAVNIEYEYYVQRERAKEEQRALKEQMRQEAEERKLLEQQKKQVEAEEAKYVREIDRITAQMQASNAEEVAALRAQLDAVQDKKDEIVRLQNGKAGTVYVISNIGSFGEDVFKVGMTRRLEPMDRVRELGDASVPFPFDVHSFIFSEDAVGLESKLHAILNNDRVNKINLRKEFFRVSLDRLQEIVESCDPSAAFNRTALAEQFRQSLSIDVVPDQVDASALDDDDDE